MKKCLTFVTICCPLSCEEPCPDCFEQSFVGQDLKWTTLVVGSKNYRICRWGKNPNMNQHLILHRAPHGSDPERQIKQVKACLGETQAG